MLMKAGWEHVPWESGSCQTARSGPGEAGAAFSSALCPSGKTDLVLCSCYLLVTGSMWAGPPGCKHWEASGGALSEVEKRLPNKGFSRLARWLCGCGYRHKLY